MIRKVSPLLSDRTLKSETRDFELTFSFRYFTNDEELCPRAHVEGCNHRLYSE